MYFCQCTEGAGPCFVCIEKRELAQMFRNAVVRMRIARVHGDSFVFARESQALGDRIMWEQWMYLRMHEAWGADWND